MVLLWVKRGGLDDGRSPAGSRGRPPEDWIFSKPQEAKRNSRK